LQAPFTLPKNAGSIPIHSDIIWNELSIPRNGANLKKVVE
jgi:hypothetical protein